MVYYLNAKSQENPYSSFGEKLWTTNYGSDLIGPFPTKGRGSKRREKVQIVMSSDMIGPQLLDQSLLDNVELHAKFQKNRPNRL